VANAAGPKSVMIGTNAAAVVPNSPGTRSGVTLGAIAPNTLITTSEATAPRRPKPL
jgi:hypothetical protein